MNLFNKLKRRAIYSLIIFFGLTALYPVIFSKFSVLKAAAVSTVSISPSSKTNLVNDTDSFSAFLNPNGENITAAEIVINYDPTIEITDITPGDFFTNPTGSIGAPVVIYKKFGNGLIDYAIAFPLGSGYSSTASGNIANIYYKAQTAGFSNVSFVVNGAPKTIISNINAEDTLSLATGGIITINSPQTPTPSPSPTPSVSPSPTPTASPSAIPSPSPTINPTDTPTPSPTTAPTTAPTASPSAIPTPTPTPALSPTPTPSASPSASPNPTDTPIPTASPTIAPTDSPTPTASPSPTPTTSPVPSASPSPSPTETPSPVSTATPSSTPPTCTVQKPGSAPVLLTITAPRPNEITITWTKAQEPVSYYLVAYGTKSGIYNYGNPNAGDKNTNSYTITNLSGNTKYYVAVRAGNGCMPGDFSNELSIKAKGKKISAQATDFLLNVLAAEDIATPTPSPAPEPTLEPTSPPEITPEVRGISTVNNNYQNLWLIVLLILGIVSLSGMLSYLIYKENKFPKI